MEMTSKFFSKASKHFPNALQALVPAPLHLWYKLELPITFKMEGGPLFS